MLDVGQTVDRYTVESIIGYGGTAVVYLVKHNQLETVHALKVLSVSSGAIRERMLREGRVQAALTHPNVVAVSDVLDVDGILSGRVHLEVLWVALQKVYHWLENQDSVLISA